MSGISKYGDTFMLDNAGSKQIKKPENISELRRIKTKCVQCKSTAQIVRSLLDEINSIMENEVIGACEHFHGGKSLTKTRKRSTCDQTCKERQQRLQLWLCKVNHVLQAIANGEGVSKQTLYKDLELQRILHAIQEPVHIREKAIDSFLNMGQEELMSLQNVSENKEMLEKLLSKMKLEGENRVLSSESPSFSEEMCMCKYLKEQCGFGSKKIETSELTWGPLKDFGRTLRQEGHENLMKTLLDQSKALPRELNQNEELLKEIVQTINTALKQGLPQNVLLNLINNLTELNKTIIDDFSEGLNTKVTQALIDDLKDLLLLGTSKYLNQDLITFLVDLSNFVTHENKEGLRGKNIMPQKLFLDSRNAMIEKLATLNKALAAGVFDTNILQELSSNIHKAIGRMPPNELNEIILEVTNLIKSAEQGRSKTVNLELLQGFISDARKALGKELTKDSNKKMGRASVCSQNKSLTSDKAEQRIRSAGLKKKEVSKNLRSKYYKGKTINKRFSDTEADIAKKGNKSRKNEFKKGFDSIDKTWRKTGLDRADKRNMRQYLIKDKDTEISKKKVNKLIGIKENKHLPTTQFLKNQSKDMPRKLHEDARKLSESELKSEPKSKSPKKKVNKLIGIIEKENLPPIQFLKNRSKQMFRELHQDARKLSELESKSKLESSKKKVNKLTGTKENENLPPIRTLKNRSKQMSRELHQDARKLSESESKSESPKNKVNKLTETKVNENLPPIRILKNGSKQMSRKLVQDARELSDLESESKSESPKQKGNKLTGINENENLPPIRILMNRSIKMSRKLHQDARKLSESESKSESPKKKVNKLTGTKETKNHPPIQFLKNRSKQIPRELNQDARKLSESESELRSESPKKKVNKLAGKKENKNLPHIQFLKNRSKKIPGELHQNARKLSESESKSESPKKKVNKLTGTKENKNLPTIQFLKNRSKQMPRELHQDARKLSECLQIKTQAKLEINNLKNQVQFAKQVEKGMRKNKRPLSSQGEMASDQRTEITIFGEPPLPFDANGLDEQGDGPEPMLTSPSSSARCVSKSKIVKDGVIRYRLSNEEFIRRGWTTVPKEKNMQRMNIYKMEPANSQNSWFDRHKEHGALFYDSGQKLADIDANGRGKWYYRNGKIALDYYDTQESNIGQRYVVYSSGTEMDGGKIRPRTVLALFDVLGNCVVYDLWGNIRGSSTHRFLDTDRVKYNQSEGVLVDPKIGPPSKWKWHSLNDPPVFQRILVDKYLEERDPKLERIMEAHIGDKSIADCAKCNVQCKMVSIELNNFVKEKKFKLKQTFQPFQIRMKTVKLNEEFTLTIVNQGTIHLLFRDGMTNMKLNLGMLLKSNKIIDTVYSDVGDVLTPYDVCPAKSESIDNIHKILKSVRSAKL